MAGRLRWLRRWVQDHHHRAFRQLGFLFQHHDSVVHSAKDFHGSVLGCHANRIKSSLNLGFTDREKARMHDLAVRNQEDALTPAEKELLLAFGKAGDLLAILKSKARRTLGINPKKRTRS